MSCESLAAQLVGLGLAAPPPSEPATERKGGVRVKFTPTSEEDGENISIRLNEAGYELADQTVVIDLND